MKKVLLGAPGKARPQSGKREPPQYLHEGALGRNGTVHTLGQVPNELRVPQEAVDEAVAGLAGRKG